MSKAKILFLAANPKGTTQLALDEEIREITHKIRLSDGRDVLEVISAWAVRPDDLLQQLNQHKPQIVHFSGHGSDVGEIILLDADTNIMPISPDALKALFTTLKDDIKIVVLNACYSQIQGKAINEVIDYVIGMKTAIGDKAAIVFAASFYSALGFQRSVQEAFNQAKTALLLENIPEEDTPQLLIRNNVDPNSYTILAGNTSTKYEGSIKMKKNHEQKPSIGIGGNVEGQNIIIGGTQTIHGDLDINVGTIPAASGDIQETLKSQIEQLIEALKAVPAGETNKVQEVKIAAEDAVSEAEKEQPDKNRLKIRGESLKKAAENLASITPTVLSIASQVVATLMKIG
jgi:hypothetical protein